MRCGPDVPLEEQPDKYWSDWVIDNTKIGEPYVKFWNIRNELGLTNDTTQKDIADDIILSLENFMQEEGIE